MKKINLVAITLCLSVLVVPAAYAFSPEDVEPVDIHGFISQGYLYSTNNNWLGASENGTWQFNELGLNFTSMLTDRLRIGMQFFARDVGVIGNDEITVDWAYADFHVKDWFGIRAGQMKNPQGLYNELRDIDFLRNSVFIPQPVYNEAARDAFMQTKGIGIYGNIDARAMGMLRYLGLFGTTGIDTEGGTARIVEEASTAVALNLTPGAGGSLLAALIKGDITGFDVERTYIISLEWQLPVEGLRIAGSFHRIDYTVDLTLSVAGTPILAMGGTLLEQETWVASIEYTFHDLLLAAEFLRSYAYGTHIEAWYGMASYRLFDWFALGVYYGEYYPDDSDKSGRSPGLLEDYQAWTKTIAGFVRFDINENWLVKGEYQYNDGVATLSRVENLNNAGFASFHQYWDFLAFKVTFNF